jgi:hypothetical protein
MVHRPDRLCIHCFGYCILCHAMNLVCLLYPDCGLGHRAAVVSMSTRQQLWCDTATPAATVAA